MYTQLFADLLINNNLKIHFLSQLFIVLPDIPHPNLNYWKLKVKLLASETFKF